MTNFIRISFVVRTEGTEGRALHEIGFLMTSHSPHCRAVEVDHQPLARVEGDGVRELDSFHPLPELGTHEGRPGVGGVHMEPELLLLQLDLDKTGDWMELELFYFYFYLDVLEAGLLQRN